MEKSSTGVNGATCFYFCPKTHIIGPNWAAVYALAAVLINKGSMRCCVGQNYVGSAEETPATTCRGEKLQSTDTVRLLLLLRVTWLYAKLDPTLFVGVVVVVFKRAAACLMCGLSCDCIPVCG